MCLVRTFSGVMPALFCVATLVWIASAQESVAAQHRPPNVIFILADDLGWGDLGCYGHPHIKTPHIDRLARQGTLFTQFYVNGSVCSPSRCAFFTGQYPARHKIHGHFATPAQNQKRGMSQWLDEKVHNVPSLLKTVGYATAHIGKWHLGSNSGGPQPDQYGFDFVGSGESGGSNGPANDPLYRAKSSELFVDEAIEFIQSHRDQPYYLQLWTLVPHATLNPTDEQVKPYARFHPGGRNFPHRSAAENYYASVTDLDTQLGRLFAALDELKMTNNTLVLFSSDNGPEDIHIANAGHSGVGSAGPFRGRKRSLYEGGVRVPGIIRWPGHVPAGTINDTAVLAAVDWMPSLAKLTGATVAANHKLDGEDMSDVWLGAERARQTSLMWEWRFSIAGEPFHHSPQLAIREGKWKLLSNPDRSRVELYDVTSDLTQLNNVASQHPDLVQRLTQRVLDWQRELPAGPTEAGAGRMRLPLPRTTEASKR